MKEKFLIKKFKFLKILIPIKFFFFKVLFSKY